MEAPRVRRFDSRQAASGVKTIIMRVTLIQGGGIGVDMVPAVQELLAAAGVAIEWDEHLAGGAAALQGLWPWPQAMLDSVRQTGLALKTKLLPAPGEVRVNYNILLRRELGLYASVRPLKNLPGLASRFQNVDMLVVRELTEDLYASIEHAVVPGVVQRIKVVTEPASQRCFRFALAWARATGSRRGQCGHGAAILTVA